MCEGKSMYQLTLDLGLRDPKPRGGDRKSGKDLPKLTEEQKFQQRIDDAIVVFRAALDKLGEYISKDFHLLLPENSLKTNLTKLSALQTALRDALKSREN